MVVNKDLKEIVPLINECANALGYVHHNQLSVLALGEKILALYPIIKNFPEKTNELTKLLGLMRAGSVAVVEFVKNRKPFRQEEPFDLNYVFFKESAQEQAKFEQLLADIDKLCSSMRLPLGEASSSQKLDAKELCRNPLLYVSTDAFIGHGAQLAKAAQLIEDDTSSKLMVVLITGVMGVGKTAFARRLATMMVEGYEDQHFFLRCRANSRFPLTITESMQQIVKKSTSGHMPQNEDALVKAYHKVFEGKKTILLIDDPLKERQVLQLLPRCEEPDTRVCVIVTSRRKMPGLRTCTKAVIDEIDTAGTVTSNSPPIGSGADSSKGTSKASPALQEHQAVRVVEKEAAVDNDEEGDDGFEDADFASKRQQGKSKGNKQHDEAYLSQAHETYEEAEKIFGHGSKTVVVEYMQTDDTAFLEDDEDSRVDPATLLQLQLKRDAKFPCKYHLIDTVVEQLSMKEGVQLLRTINSDIDVFTGKTISLLCANIPLFLISIAGTLNKCPDLRPTDLVKEIGAELQKLTSAQTSTNQFGPGGANKLERICDVYLTLPLSKWPPRMSALAIKLAAVYPFSFDAVSVSHLLDMDFTEVSELLFDLMEVGFLEGGCSYLLRNCLHDLVRETLLTYIEDKLASTDPKERQLVAETDELQEKYLQFYFDLMHKVDMEHFWAGCDQLPGLECWDIELENMKSVLEFMKKNGPEQHIEALMACRHVYRDRMFAEARGFMYHQLSRDVEAVNDPAIKAYYYASFAQAYWDLTDRNRGYSNAKKALEILEAQVAKNISPDDEKRLLPVLQMMGDMCKENHSNDISLQYYRQVESISLKRAWDWQKSPEFKQQLGIEAGDQTEALVLDPCLAHAKIRIGTIMLVSGNYDEGKKLFDYGMQILLRAFGHSHPIIASFYDEYASLLKTFRKYDEIDGMYKKAIEIDQGVFGKDSNVVADRMNQWAVALLEQGKFGAAEELYDKIIAIRTKQYGGTNHENIAAALNNKAVALKNQGRYEEAQRLYQQSLDILIAIKGEGHPDVAVAMSNLANVMANQTSQGDKAEKMYKDALIMLRKRYGEDHELVAAMLINIGDSLRKQNNPTEALQHYEDALKIRKKLAGTNEEGQQHGDPVLASTTANIGNLLFEQGEFEKSAQYFDEAIQMFENTLGADHPHYASSLTNMANALYRQGKFDEAEVLFQKSLDIQKKGGHSDARIIPTLQSLGITLERQRKYAETEKVFMELYERKKQAKHSFQSREETLIAVATAITKQSRFAEAEQTFLQIIALHQQEVQEEDIALADLYNNLAATQIFLQHWQDAQASFEKAFALLDRIAPDDDKTRDTADKLANVRIMIASTKRRKCCTVL